jgi:hypothetical protein
MGIYYINDKLKGYIRRIQMEGKNELRKVYALVDGQSKLRHTYLYEQGTEESQGKLLKEEIYNNYGGIKTKTDFVASTELNVEYMSLREDLPHQIHRTTNLVTGEVTKREIKGVQYGNTVIIYDEVTGKATISIYNNMDTKLLLVKSVLGLNDQRTVSHMIYSYTSYRHDVERMIVIIPAKKEFKYFYSKSGLLANITENGTSILTDGNYSSFRDLVSSVYGKINYSKIRDKILLKPTDNFEVLQRRPSSYTIVAANQGHTVTIESLPHDVVMVTEKIDDYEYKNIIMPDGGSIYFHDGNFSKLMMERDFIYNDIECHFKEFIYSKWNKEAVRFDKYQKHRKIYDMDGNLLEEIYTDL